MCKKGQSTQPERIPCEMNKYKPMHSLSELVFFANEPNEKVKWRSHSVVSDSLRPHGLYPTMLLHPWDFPGKSTRVNEKTYLLVLILIPSFLITYNYILNVFPISLFLSFHLLHAFCLCTCKNHSHTSANTSLFTSWLILTP